MNFQTVRRKALAAAVMASMAALAACGGGSAPTVTAVAPPPPPPPPVPKTPGPPLPSRPPAPPPPSNALGFTSWTATVPPGAVKLTGLGVAVVNGSSAPVDTSDQTLTLNLKADGKLNGLWISNQNYLSTLIPDHDFFSSYGVLDATGSAVTVNAGENIENVTDPLVTLSYAQPAAQGWNYQTFGWWYDLTLPDRPRGAFSVGAPSLGSAIPSAGAAVFNGKLAGYFPSFDFQVIAAPMSLSVDFAARSASFSSSDWRVNSGSVSPGTALSGTLAYGVQQNLLTGTLTTANGQYSGPASAQFYGPAAQEVGGTMTLTTSGGAIAGTIVAGFGAAR